MSERHNREFFFLADRGEVRGPVATAAATREASPEYLRPATHSEADRMFRFSEIVTTTSPLPSEELLLKVAEVMTQQTQDIDSPIPAGFTYLGQFVDHDLTRDVTNVPFGTSVATPEELMQGRSPSLDLDSLYGGGPTAEPGFYDADRIKLKLGRTQASGPAETPNASRDLDGFDLPRIGSGTTDPAQVRLANIPDQRNDENLAVAQIHLAFIRFHNRVCDRLASAGTPSALLFERARELVTKHYHWMLRHDYLPRVVDPRIVNDVFRRGRLIVEPGSSDVPTMPLEFSVGAFRLGHSMIREIYDWNAVFGVNGSIGDFGTLLNLFLFSGTSGNLNPGTDSDDPIAGSFERLPTNWVIDWTRMFDFVRDGSPELAPETFVNFARPLDIRLTDPLRQLPLGSFGARGPSAPPISPGDRRRNLAFRNLMRGRMVQLATGQELAARINAALTAAGRTTETFTPLSRDQILGDEFGELTAAEQDFFATHTPLWFYVLREASLNLNGGQPGTGRLGNVGGRIVAEVFHRAMGGSRISLLRDPEFSPTLGAVQGVFRMTDLLQVAYDARRGELRPLSPAAGRPQDPGGAATTAAVVRDLLLQSPILRGSDVSSLQRALGRRGLALQVDGAFGPRTDAAVRQWQSSRGLAVDGVVGMRTRQSLGLQRQLRRQTPLQRGDDVRVLQRALQGAVQIRLSAPDGSFDGVFGERTELAVRTFQSRQGLLVDGIAGPLTLGELRLI
jgi:peptidoglycan hydrolase-like protein with peptidoglycan-binding domain